MTALANEPSPDHGGQTLAAPFRNAAMGRAGLAAISTKNKNAVAAASGRTGRRRFLRRLAYGGRHWLRDGGSRRDFRIGGGCCAGGEDCYERDDRGIAHGVLPNLASRTFGTVCARTHRRATRWRRSYP